MGGSAPAPVQVNTAAMLPPPNPQGTYDILKATSKVGGDAMDLHRKNLELASFTTPIRMEYNPTELSKQTAEFGVGNLLRERNIESFTNPAAARMRLNIGQQVEEATSPDFMKSFMDRYAKERGISAISGSGIDPNSTIGRSAIFDATTEAGRKLMLDNIQARQGYLQATPTPIGGIDPGAAISAQEANRAQNIGQMNAWQAGQFQNIFGMGQGYSDFVNKMMGETLSANQAEQANLRQYQEKLINDLVGQANAENQMRAGAAQGDQAMTGALAGAGIGAVGLIAAAMI
jgi:hypothetical protein